MQLEGQFKDLKLTRRQFRRLKKRAINTHYQEEERGNYGIKHVVELFKGTDVNEEDIVKGIKEINRKKDRRRFSNKMVGKGENFSASRIMDRLGDYVPFVFGVIVLGFLGLSAYFALKEDALNAHYKKEYTRISREYADRDRDNVINTKEESALVRDILRKTKKH